MSTISLLKFIKTISLILVTFTIFLSQISMVFAKTATLDQGFANSTTNQIKSFDGNTGAQLTDTGAAIANQIKNLKLVANSDGTLIYRDIANNLVHEVRNNTVDTIYFQPRFIDARFNIMDIFQNGAFKQYVLQDKNTGEPFIAYNDVYVNHLSDTMALINISPGFNSPQWKIIDAEKTQAGYQIYWQNQATGLVSVWNMNSNNTFASFKDIVNPGVAWRLVDVTYSRMLLQNTITGEPLIYNLNASLNIVRTSNPWPGFNSSEWRIINTEYIYKPALYDSFDSIIWQNNNTGVVSVWFMNSNNTIHSTKDYPAVGSNWKLVSLVNVTTVVANTLVKNYKLTWQHNVNGSTSIWNTNANLDATGSYDPLSFAFSSEWELKKIIPATATIKKSLIFRNRFTGKLQLYRMLNNGAFYNVEYLSSINWTLNLEWRFVEAYYSTLTPTISSLDIVLQNTLTGEPVIKKIGNISLNPASTFNAPEWKLVKVTDMNKDGTRDFIWQNSNNGAVAIWYLDSTGLRTLAHKVYPPVGTDWKLIDVANINNDGNVDFIWQLNSTSGVSMWLLDGSNNVISYVDPSPGFNAPSWKIVKVEDMNEDGRGDFVWQNTNGTVVIWYLNNNGIPYSTNTVLQTGLGADYVLVK